MKFFYEEEQYKNTLRITRQLFEVLNKCVSDDELRYFLEYPYLNKEKKELYATDGRGIIIINIPFELKEFETDFCVPVKSKNNYYLIQKKLEGTFPKTDSVIPNYPDDKIKISDVRYYPGKSNKSMYDNSVFLFKLQKETGCLVNLKYLEVLKSLGPFNLKSDGDEKSLEFCGDGWKYVLMPMLKKDV